MPRFLDTIGHSTLSIGICDRCRFKVPLDELHADANNPGIRVCRKRGCNDLYDPYKLPARRTEQITVRFPRTDEPIEVEP